MDLEKPKRIFCSVIAMDSSNFSYRACAICERTLLDQSFCSRCDYKAFHSRASGSTRFYRLLLSIAVGNKAIIVVLFDRAARVLFGCSADELFDFARDDPSAVARASKMLQGEILEMTLQKPTSGNAEHLRATCVVPLNSAFCPLIERLRNKNAV